jgi:hypothetical protein
MLEGRGRVWGFLLSAIFIAAGMASCAHPAWSQHPTHNPPPRPPVHQPPRQSPPQRQVVKPQPPQPQKAVVPQPPRQQESGIPGVATPQAPAVGTRVPSAGTTGGSSGGVPHPPVRPWEQRNADIPASERPPPGMCRVWLDHVPAASQPAPTSCSKAIQMHPPNGHVVFGEDGRRPTATRVPPATPPESSADNDH